MIEKSKKLKNYSVPGKEERKCKLYEQSKETNEESEEINDKTMSKRIIHNDKSL